MTPDSPPKPRRFYKAVEVDKSDIGFAVRLDGRAAKTPGAAALAVPTLALARCLAAEWDAQTTEIDFSVMPLTKLAFTVLDQAESAHAGMAEEVARYAGADLLCYLAESPSALAEREASLWGPWLAWAEEALGVSLVTCEGVSPISQSPESLARVRTLAASLDPFELTGLTMATGLYGSAVLGFAVQRGAIGAEASFDLSRLDEAFQEEHWGVDAEAQVRTERLRAEARMLGVWFDALRN